MLVILREDVKKLGKAGETVRVKNGYGRNYLIPQGFAYPATDAFMNVYMEENKGRIIKERKAKVAAEALKAQLDGKAFSVKVKTGEDDKLFGSVTSQNIADLVAAAGIEIDKKRIQLEESIKSLGEHKVKYKAHSEVEIEIVVNVEKDGE